MRRRLVVTMMALVAFGAPAGAQTTPGFQGPRIWLGYYGELGTHPGIAAGAQFQLADAGWYELSAGPVVGLYVHPRNHIGLFVDAELENRFAFASGLYFTIGANAGYYHTWLSGGDVYTRADDGSVARSGDWGRPYAKTGGSFGLGWDLARKDIAPLALFSRLDLFAQYPFNDAVLPHAAVLAGAAFRSGGAE